MSVLRFVLIVLSLALVSSSSTLNRGLTPSGTGRTTRGSYQEATRPKRARERKAEILAKSTMYTAILLQLLYQRLGAGLLPQVIAASFALKMSLKPSSFRDSCRLLVVLGLIVGVFSPSLPPKQRAFYSAKLMRLLYLIVFADLFSQMARGLYRRRE